MSNLRKDFSKIYDQCIDKIYRFVFIKVNSQEIAEDLTSETFLRGWEAFKKSSNPHKQKIDNPQAFLYQIARNLITDHYREKGRTQFVPIDCVPVFDPTPNLEETTQIKSDLELIKSAITSLNNEDYQEFIIWHYIDDLSVEEIANITGKTEGAVRVTIHRALKSLKNILEEEKIDRETS